MNEVYGYEGFNILQEELESIIKEVENVQDVLEVGAKEFVKDLSKLTKPYSEIHKPGYTHLIDTFSYRKVPKNEIEVGWGKYYGRIVEYGSKKMKSRSHLRPTFEKNKEKYYKLMLNKIGLN